MNGNMNMNYNQGPGPGPYQYPGMNNNLNNQEVQEDPKKAKLKKRIFTLVKFIVIFIIMFFGRNYIRYITVDYKSVVDSSLTGYYVTGDTSKLMPIAELLNEYKKNAKIVDSVQSYSYQKVTDWFTSLDDKYLCDKNNKNSCLVQLDEFKFLVKKLNELYNVKGGGYSIIAPKGYSALKEAGEQKIEALNAISRNQNYQNPSNSEVIYQNKCNNATDCDCRDGICKCTYIGKNTDGSKKQESIQCYKPDTIQKK